LVLERGEPALELTVQVHRTGDRAHRAGARAELGRGLRGRGVHPRVVRQTEVVVRREVDDVPAVEPRPGAGRSLEGPRLQQQPLLVEVGELLLQVVERTRHRNLTLPHTLWRPVRPTDGRSTQRREAQEASWA